MRRRVIAALLAVAAVAGAEGLARVAFDFPLYGADSEVGYWILPNQQGAFLFTNDWAFNGDSLGIAEEFRPSEKLDVLLVGDSVVLGGNELRQADKLGPMIEAETGWQVWPASASSWGLQNELAFLRRNPELVEDPDIVVFVLNLSDFPAPSEWRSPLTHPRERPALYLPYLFERYVRKPQISEASPLPVPQRDLLADWRAFIGAAGKPVIVIAYTSRRLTGQDCAWMPPGFMQAGEWTCYDPMATIGENALRDVIHPTALGNRALAGRIAAFVRSELDELDSRP